MKRQNEESENTEEREKAKPRIERSSSVVALLNRVVEGYRYVVGGASSKDESTTKTTTTTTTTSTVSTTTTTTNTSSNSSKASDIDTSTAHLEQLIFMPYEVMFKIFHEVPRATLDICKCVCKYWLKVGSDPELAWRCVGEFMIYDSYFMVGYPNQQYLHGEARVRAYENWVSTNCVPEDSKIIPQINWAENQHHGFPLKNPNTTKIIGYGVLVDPEEMRLNQNYYYNQHTQQWILTFLQSYEKTPEIWDIDIRPQESCKQVYNRIWDAKTRSYTDEKCDGRRWPLDVYVNTLEFERYVKIGKEIPHKDFIFTLIQTSYAHFNFPSYAHKPIAQTVTHKQPDGIKLKLYKYQLDAVNWMKSVEEDKDIWLKYCTLAPWRKARSDLLFDLENRKIVSVQDADVDKAIHKMRATGGILADEMGLGKTIEILGLIKANPLPSAFENELIENRYVTRATLVLCPSHLAKQWTEELEKHSDPKLKVCMVTTIRQHDKFNYRAFKDADAVIVSYNFLKNPNYMSTHSHKLVVNEDTDNDEWANPVFQHFHWRRVILDEGHEVIGGEHHSALCELATNTRWYMTGTPFPSDLTMNSLFDFLKVKSTNTRLSGPGNLNQRLAINYWNITQAQTGINVYERWVLGDLIFNNLYWRNTKDSVKKEYEIPPFVEDVVLLDFHPVEQVMYEDARLRGQEGRMRMLCNHPLLHQHDVAKFGNGHSLEGIRQTFMAKALGKPEYFETKIPICEKAIDTALTTLTDLKREQANRANNPQQHYYNDQWQINNAESQLLAARAKLKKVKQAKERWERLSPQILSIPAPTEEELMDIVAQPAVVQKPSKGTASLKKPPQKMTVTELKKELKKRDADLDGLKKDLLARLVELLRKENENLQEEGQAFVLEESHTKALIQADGTKFTAAVAYMTKLWNTDSNSRILIFSQFSGFLRKVGAELERNGIKNVFVEGNVHMRNNAITQFKDKEWSLVRVMMLSLENAASGTNLMEASHVILLDPVQGDRKAAQAIEQQAIGRAYRQGQKQNVTVVRFIIRDTIEHQQYLLQVMDENADPSELKSHSNTPKTQKTTSVASKIANLPKLKKEGSVVNLIENENMS